MSWQSRDKQEKKVKSTKAQEIIAARLKELTQSLSTKDLCCEGREADPLDNLEQQKERDLAVSQLNHCAREVKLLNDGMEKITNGSYGICDWCNEGISLKRLNAVPWATLCIHCQEAKDAQKDGGATMEEDELEAVA